LRKNKENLFIFFSKRNEPKKIFYSFSGAENEPRDIHPHQGLSLYGEDATRKIAARRRFSSVLVSRDTRWLFIGWRMEKRQ
jgi:hypothetical protein